MCAESKQKLYKSASEFHYSCKFSLLTDQTVAFSSVNHFMIVSVTFLDFLLTFHQEVIDMTSSGFFYSYSLVSQITICIKVLAMVEPLLSFLIM